MSGFILSDSWILTPTSVPSLFWYALIEVYEENLALLRYVVGKQRSTFLASQGNCGYSLILYQYSGRGSFLKFLEGTKWNLKPYQWTLPALLCWNPLVSLVLWRDLLLMNDFVLSCAGHLESTDSLSHSALSNVDTFHHTVFKKSPLLLSSFFSVGKPLRSSGILSSSWW